jgi:glucose/mannose-6-phosphate isomerase
MMRDAILNFNQQFAFKPVVVNARKLKKTTKFVIAGMGGSHLAGDLLKIIDPTIEVIIHSDYGLPEIDLKKYLIILSSYSGNTEEILTAYQLAKKKKLPMAVIAVGGKLLAAAKKDDVPYIELPDTGIQPRSALGFSLRALLKLVGKEKELRQTDKLAKILPPVALENIGKALAQKLVNKIPIIYSSRRNFGIAYNWKIKLNETGKIPAFCNVFPELNHNEANGFDVKSQIKNLFEKYYFIFLTDKQDYLRVQKRMKITAKLYQDRGLPVEILDLSNKNIFVKIFQSLILADWTAVAIAEHYGLESEQVPMVEEFKKLMSNSSNV